MGKKAKKKARSGHKDKRVATTSSISLPKDHNLTLDQVTDVASVAKERKGCNHIDKSMDLTKVSSKLESVEAFRCEDCREGMVDRKAAKGKGKHGKKKGTDSKAIWVCLECGHFGCGGVGLPTTQQSHAVRHARQTRHPLVIQVENPHLRWCFPCSALIPLDRLEESGEQKDVLSDVVKLIKKQPPGGGSVDVEDVWFGSGSVASEVKSERSLLTDMNECDFYAVRGLTNLGNTCFFNSVLQNLLAMDRLQEYLTKLGDSTGPLTNSLKKLYVEINAETGVRNVLNPKSLFGCICSKAPQFRGYQQQDSHELLRYLLDGLSTEDLRVKKLNNSSPEHDKSSHVSPSFVDIIFGGQLSSTVWCVECGHSSVVYEPFLDLSLPVPTRKPPPKKGRMVSRTSKTKPPPKRVGTNTCPKQGKDGISAPILGDPSPSSECSSGVEPSAVTAEGTQDSLNDFTWMDYLDPTSLEDQQDLALQLEELTVSGDYVRTETTQNYAIHQDVDTCSSEVLLNHGDPNVKSDSILNSFEDEVPLQVGDSEILLLPFKEETVGIGNVVERDVEPSSSAVGDGEDMSGFDGFADMFNEPEVSIGPSLKPENGFLAGNSSESNPDEVDDTDSPVSIESCLSDFTKRELLSGEHAWHCENCTRTMLEKKRKSRKNKLKSVSAIQNGCDDNFSNFEMKKQISHSQEEKNHQLTNSLSDGPDSALSNNIGGNSSEESNKQVEDCESGESADEQPDSKSVKVMRDATKRILISKLPPILTVHLKRFSQDARGRLSKLKGHVVFKEVIDLKPYMDSRCSERQEECKYHLVGVVEHLGSMRGGHYVAYVRGGDRRQGGEAEGRGNRKSVWYYASDAHVRETNLEDVLRCEAYILFYEKL